MGNGTETGCTCRAHKVTRNQVSLRRHVLQWNLTDFHHRAVENRQQNSILKLLRFSGWRRLRSFNTVTLCVSSFEGPQELTPQELKKSKRERERKVPKSGLTKLVLVRPLKKQLVLNGTQCKVVGNVCFVAAYLRQKSAYTVNRKALKCWNNATIYKQTRFYRHCKQLKTQLNTVLNMPLVKCDLVGLLCSICNKTSVLIASIWKTSE